MTAPKTKTYPFNHPNSRPAITDIKRNSKTNPRDVVKEEDGPETGPEIEDEDDPEDIMKHFEGRYFRHPGGMGWEGPDD